jgi:hypothetical protein
MSQVPASSSRELSGSGEREGGLRRVDRDQHLGELMLSGDDLPPVALELRWLGAGRTELLTARDERRDVALERFDAWVLRHDHSYDI